MFIECEQLGLESFLSSIAMALCGQAGSDVIGKAQVQVLQRQLEKQYLKGSVEVPPLSARSRHMQLVLLCKCFMGSMPGP